MLPQAWTWATLASPLPLTGEDGGAPPEDARYALGNAVASRIWVQMNAREFFLAFLPLRTGLGAFHEIRLVAWLMFSAVAGRFPVTARWAWEHVTDHPIIVGGD